MIDPSADAQEVLPRLWLGSAGAARPAIDAGFAVLCVLETPTFADEHHIPILVASPDSPPSPTSGPRAHADRLDDAASWIGDRWDTDGRDVLVHCAAGVERSPLTLAWFFVSERICGFDRAYAWLKARRPVVEDRRAWLERVPE